VGIPEGNRHCPAVLNPGESCPAADPYYPPLRRAASCFGRSLRLPLQRKPAAADFAVFHQQPWDQLKLMAGVSPQPHRQVGRQQLCDEAAQPARVLHTSSSPRTNRLRGSSPGGEAPALLRNPHWRRCGIESFSFSKSLCLVILAGLRDSEEPR